MQTHLARQPPFLLILAGKVAYFLGDADTLKLQKRPALDFLVQALSAHRNGQPSPKLLAAG